MNCKYIKELKSIDLIDKFQQATEYKFCEFFRKFIAINNGGMPERNIFDTDKTKDRTVKSFLSFNCEDKESIWNAVNWLDDEMVDIYIPFALDNFGNMICFDRNDGSVVFIDLENLSIENIAKDFDDFLCVLHD